MGLLKKVKELGNVINTGKKLVEEVNHIVEIAKTYDSDKSGKPDLFEIVEDTKKNATRAVKLMEAIIAEIKDDD